MILEIMSIKNLIKSLFENSNEPNKVLHHIIYHYHGIYYLPEIFNLCY